MIKVKEYKPYPAYTYMLGKEAAAIAMQYIIHRLVQNGENPTVISMDEISSATGLTECEVLSSKRRIEKATDKYGFGIKINKQNRKKHVFYFC